ncbi:TlpA family protein disulfide reductase [Horticoccus luteus]|uniref:TlpA family protein disulfide reductase n=1 Tax=Horticoccus luteus TaxID=2862869 RepID=A0A8F9XK86_9BACT|nr:TlpA disulfide reductase family protein [Horticoccus luteus]QYM77829.1 TlpA family protein disulfide reductase [Horticoccus luteus]
MKSRALRLPLLAATLLLSLGLRAQTPPAVVVPKPVTPPPSAPAPAVPPIVAPAESPAETDLKQLVGDISTKLRAAQNTPEALAPELQRFDALLEKYAAQKTEDTAGILASKAMLYLQVFQDYPRGAELLQQLQKDFPNTGFAQRATAVLAELGPILASSKVSAALKVGTPFPAFSETDLDGHPLTLAALKGKIVLVDFWATWCGPCVQELPNVVAAYEKYHAKGFEIVGISLDHDRAKLVAFMQERHVTWPQYFDGAGWKNKLAKAYGVNSIPATYLLDGDGKIIAKDLRGPALERELAQRLP